MGPVLYYSVAAQDDNLGDLVIRRIVLDWLLSAAPHRIVVFTGTMSADYLNALPANSRVRYVRGASAFELQLLRSCLARRAHLIFAPGPEAVADRPALVLKLFANLANVFMVHTGGGAVLAIGRALRGNGRLAARLLRAVVGLSKLYVVRDWQSGETIGVSLRAAPDVGLALAVPSTVSTRSRVAISLRGDHPVAASWFERLIGDVRGLGLEPVLVTQVRRDDAQHIALGKQHDVEVVAWGALSHAAQLERVLTAYATARAVVTDRLHAAIFGFVAGAAPIASRAGKVVETLARVLPLPVVETHGGATTAIGGVGEAGATGDAYDDARVGIAAQLRALHADVIKALQ